MSSFKKYGHGKFYYFIKVTLKGPRRRHLEITNLFKYPRHGHKQSKTQQQQPRCDSSKILGAT